MPQRSFKKSGTSLRHKIACEAATLLYYGSEKEYKQAKLKAAQILGSRVLPSNFEVVIELDKITEEIEGSNRKVRLIQMRSEALEIMKILNTYSPVLIGSVWRGTIRRTSDIDIETFWDNPVEIVELLKVNKLKILRTEPMKTLDQGKISISYHVYAETFEKNSVEIVIRPIEEVGKKRTCDIFGDQIKGLTTKELKDLLEEMPTQTFIPN